MQAGEHSQGWSRHTLVMEREQTSAGPGEEQPAVQDLLASPRLVLHVRRFKEILEDEQKRRECFQNEAPVDQKAEFINGEIVVSEPVSAAHNKVKNRLHALLRAYLQLLRAYEIGEVGTLRGERMLISLTRNDYEPDVCFFGKEKTGTLAPDQWRLPTPDFIAEVLSLSSEERARGVKFDDYAAHGVGEYWIIDPKAQSVEQYVLEEAPEENPSPKAGAGMGRYALQAKVKLEEIESAVMGGFRIPAKALFDDAASLEALRKLVVK